MITYMLHGGPADGLMGSFRRHDPPREIRVGKWLKDAGVSTGEAWIYILGETEDMPKTSGLHRTASYHYRGDRDSADSLVTLWI